MCVCCYPSFLLSYAVRLLVRNVISLLNTVLLCVSLPQAKLLTRLLDAANGMAYLHSRGILHGELCCVYCKQTGRECVQNGQRCMV